MKNLVFALALIPALAMADMKVGTVDMMILVRNHQSYENNKKFLADSEKESQAKLESMKKDVEKVQSEGQKLADEYKNPMLAEGRRKEIEKKLAEIERKYVAGQQALRAEAMRAQQELQSNEAKFLKITGDDLRRIITAFAEKNGYDLVLDVTAAPYSKKSLDVTDAVLKSMGVDPAKAVKPGNEDKKTNESK